MFPLVGSVLWVFLSTWTVLVERHEGHLIRRKPFTLISMVFLPEQVTNIIKGNKFSWEMTDKMVGGS